MESTTGRLLRIFIDESDRWHNEPLYTAIVSEMRKNGVAGASVFKGIEGFGVHRAPHSSRVFDLSTNLPILIEVIDEPATIEAFLPRLKEMVSEGLLTLENVQMIRISKTAQ